MPEKRNIDFEKLFDLIRDKINNLSPGNLNTAKTAVEIESSDEVLNYLGEERIADLLVANWMVNLRDDLVWVEEGFSEEYEKTQK